MLAQIADITLPIFLIVLVGFFYSRAAQPDLSGVNKLLVDIALPVLIFTSLSTKDFNPHAALEFSVAVVWLVLLSGLLAWPLSRWAGVSARSFVPCAMFGNVGPIGIPLLVLAYGPAGMAPAVVALVLSNLLHFTVGVGVMSGRVDWRMLYANPLLWSTVLGIACSQAHIDVPVWLATPLGMIGQVLVPMMLLALGTRLSTSRITDVRVGVQSAVLTMGVRTLAAFVVLGGVPLQGVERGALLLFAALPPAVFNYMLADRFNQQPSQVASIVIVAHVTSLAFLPLGIWLAFL